MLWLTSMINAKCSLVGIGRKCGCSLFEDVVIQWLEMWWLVDRRRCVSFVEAVVARLR